MNISGHLRVLYAEDNEDACFMVTTMLGFSDIEVTIAGTVAEACRIGQAEYFDLFLLDTRFSDGSGLEICRCLHKYAPQTPILFYSGDAYESDKEKGLAAGANDYLIKPYFGDLAETVLQTIKLSNKPVRVSSNNPFIEFQENNQVQVSS